MIEHWELAYAVIVKQVFVFAELWSSLLEAVYLGSNAYQTQFVAVFKAQEWLHIEVHYLELEPPDNHRFIVAFDMMLYFISESILTLSSFWVEVEKSVVKSSSFCGGAYKLSQSDGACTRPPLCVLENLLAENGLDLQHLEKWFNFLQVLQCLLKAGHLPLSDVCFPLQFE